MRKSSIIGGCFLAWALSLSVAQASLVSTDAGVVMTHLQQVYRPFWQAPYAGHLANTLFVNQFTDEEDWVNIIRADVSEPLGEVELTRTTLQFK